MLNAKSCKLIDLESLCEMFTCIFFEETIGEYESRSKIHENYIDVQNNSNNNNNGRKHDKWWNWQNSLPPVLQVVTNKRDFILNSCHLNKGCMAIKRSLSFTILWLLSHHIAYIAVHISIDPIFSYKIEPTVWIHINANFNFIDWYIVQFHSNRRSCALSFRFMINKIVSFAE